MRNIIAMFVLDHTWYVNANSLSSIRQLHTNLMAFDLVSAAFVKFYIMIQPLDQSIEIEA